jgi:hypothetical protein
MHIESMWISGDDMILCGGDRLSREATVDRHDVRVTDNVWQRASDLAKDGGMELTVDWFADANNHRLSRFWAKEPAAGAEGVDALSARTWGREFCTQCRAHHDQGAWVFAPIPLLNKVVTKLRADRAHGVALVPFRPDTVWWTTLQSASSLITECTAADAVNCTLIGGHETMYTIVNWRLCRFNFGADSRLCYDAQCNRDSGWASPTASPEELDHRRRLEALVSFQESPSPQAC